jgi:hypothetical protein
VEEVAVVVDVWQTTLSPKPRDMIISGGVLFVCSLVAVKKAVSHFEIDNKDREYREM